MNTILILMLNILLLGCESETEETQATVDIEDSSQNEDTGSTIPMDTGGEEEEDCEPVVYDPNPFASSIVSFSPGDGAGFGQDSLPDIVLGPPIGGGERSGSLDVLTLGQNGEIVLGFDVPIIDGAGADLIVYENPFIGWPESGIVSVSQDGETWYSWPCDSLNSDAAYPGCAGITPTLSHPDNCIDATDPSSAGGDHFDLAELGLSSASFVRIQDSGDNPDGGFDLDSVAVIHAASN